MKNETSRTGLRLGYEICAAETETMYLTANSNAKSSAEIKRDHMKGTSKFVYLDKQMDAHNALFYAINKNGVVHVYDNDKKTISKQEEDALDAVHDAIIPLLKHNGEVYGDAIRKESRNAASRYLDAKNRDADEMNAVSIEEQTDARGDSFTAEVVGNLFENGGGTFSTVVMEALKKLPTEYAVIVSRIAEGDTQEVIAEDLNRSQSYVAKKYKLAIQQLQAFLVLDNGKVKAK